MTPEQHTALENIQGLAGFVVLQAMAKEKMEKLDSVRNIVKDGLVAEQTLARQLAYEILNEFLSEMKLVDPAVKTVDRTHE